MPDAEGPGLVRLEDGFSNFTMVPNEVVRSTSLSAPAKALYMVLIDVAYRHASPTQQELGGLLGGGEKLARAALTELRDAGLLEAHRPGLGRSNYYVLMRPKGTSGSLNGPEGRSGASPGAVPSMPLRPEKTKAPSGALVRAQPNAGAIVAHYVDATRALGGDTPARVKGQVAKLVGELLKEGITPAHVTAGVDLMVERRLHPSTLPSCVNEASMPRRAPARGRSDGRMTAEEIMARAIQHREEGR